MAEPAPFKERIDEAAVRRVAALAGLDEHTTGRLVRETVPGLRALELKARVRRVADALRAALPEDWGVAMAQVERGLPEGVPSEEGVSDGLPLWPLLTLVEVYGLEEPEVSLRALRRLTPWFSAEFAVRPYLARHPERAWAHVRAWAADADVHVRRLASEGTRPRLPWGERLRDAVRDPSRGLDVLDRLVDDPSAYVRRSVANHLGDVAKDHPARAVAHARGWVAERSDRLAVVRHGLRGLLKAGDVDALALVGASGGAVVVEQLGCDPSAVRVGDAVLVQAALRGVASGPVRVDVVWSWPGARGGWCSKVFVGAAREVEVGELWSFRHRVSTRPVTTRPVRLGQHRVTLRVAGADVAEATFTLLPSEP